MAINAVKKILNGDTPFTDVDVGTGTIGTTELVASCVTSAKIATSAVATDGLQASAVTAAKIATDAVSGLAIQASAVAKGELKYGKYTFSFAGGGSAGPGPGASGTVSVVITGGAQMIGWYLTAATVTSAVSYGQNAIFASTTSVCITVTPEPYLNTAADVLQGVIITIEP